MGDRMTASKERELNERLDRMATTMTELETAIAALLDGVKAGRIALERDAEGVLHVVG